MSRNVVLGVTLCGGVLLVAHPVRAQVPENWRVALAEAEGAIRMTDVDRAIALLQDLTSALPDRAAAETYVPAHMHLAVLFFASGERDSAAAHFAAAIRRDAFVDLDDNTYNPEVVAAFGEVKRVTAAVALSIPADTVVVPDSGTWHVQVAVGRPGLVQMQLARVEPSSTGTVLESLTVDSAATFAVAFQPRDTVVIPVRAYVLTAWMDDVPDADTAVVRFRAERLRVDTLSQEAFDSSGFRPESRRSGPAFFSFVKGAVFGAAAAAIPLLVTNPDVEPNRADPRAVAVGATIVVGGIVGIFAGRRDIPMQANVEYNRGLRAAWTERNRAIAEENFRRRLWAPLRLTRLREP